MAEITEEERKLLDAFKALGATPKADTKEDLQDWMQRYVAAALEETVEVKHEGVEASTIKRTPEHLMVVQQHTPRLSIFSGAPGKKDNESSIDLWLYEVRCLKHQGYKDSAILEAIRRSLKGEAARTVMRLGTEATLTVILDKLESVYGTVQGSEALMAEFYNATQRVDEDVAAWSCRIEDLISRAVRLGRIQTTQLNEVLRSRFWYGLRPELRDRTGHKFDSTSDFNQLRRAIRQFEIDFSASASGKTTQSKVVKSAQPQQQDELQAQVSRLSAEVKALAQELRQSRTQPPAAGRGGARGGGQQQGQGERTFPRDDQRYSAQYQSGRGRGGHNPRSEVVCWRCGEKGHVRSGCRAIMDHSRRNYTSPLND
jgi:outer membrane murein-binding lipoprotein Lpp